MVGSSQDLQNGISTYSQKRGFFVCHSLKICDILHRLSIKFGGDRHTFLIILARKLTLLHSKGRIELLHGEEFGIIVNPYPGTQKLMIHVERMPKGFKQLVVP